VVGRERGEGVNRYFIDKETLTAMGSDVPETVKELLGLEEINIQTQLDKHFMLMDSPGQVAEFVNQVTGLEQAETLADRVSEMVRSSQKAIKDNSAEVEAAEVALASPDLAQDRLNSIEAMLGSAEEIEAEKTELGRQIMRLMTIFKDIDSVLYQMEMGEEMSGFLPTVERAKELVALYDAKSLDCRDLAEKQRRLILLIGVRKVVETNIEINKKMLKLKPVVDTASGLADMYDAKLREFGDLDDKISRLNRAVEVERVVDEDLATACSFSARAELARDAFIKDLDTCPACGTALTQGMKKDVLKALGT